MTATDTRIELEAQLARSASRCAELREQLESYDAPAAGVRPVRDPAPTDETNVVDRVDKQARAMAKEQNIPLHEAYTRIFSSDAANELGIAYARETCARVKQRRAARAIADMGGWR